MTSYSSEQLTKWADEIAQGNYPFQGRYSSQRCDLPPEALIEIYRLRPGLGMDMSYIWNLPSEVLLVLANDSDSDVRLGVARHENTSTSALEILAKDKDSHIRGYVATHPNSNSTIFDILIEDKDTEVVLQLLVHEKLESRHWRQIFSDPVLFEAAFNEEYPNPSIFVVNIPEDLIAEVKDKLPSERRHHLLSSLYFPEEWIAEFVEDPKIDKSELGRRLIHRNQMRKSDVPKFLKGTDIEVRTKIAEMSELESSVQEILVKDKSATVREALARNPAADPEVLMKLLGDKAVGVMDSLKRDTYYDRNNGFKETKYVGREALIAAATGNAKVLKEKKKSTSVQGRIEQLLEWEISQSDFEELLADKSIGVKTAANMRAAERGLITFKEAVSFIEKFAPQTSQAKNQWLEFRMEEYRKTKSEVYLDLIISLKGDEQLSRLIEDKEFAVDKDQFMKILKAHLPLTNWIIATTRELNAEILDEIALTPSWSYDLFGQASGDLIFGQWEVQTTHGYRIASHPQAIAARHPLTRPETLVKLKSAKSKYVRGVILERPEFSTPEDLAKAAKDKDAYVRSLVAAHERVDLQILEKLASDRDPEVRKCAVANPKSTPEMKAAAALIDLSEGK